MSSEASIRLCGDLRTIPPLIMWHLFGLEYADRTEITCQHQTCTRGHHRAILERAGIRYTVDWNHRRILINGAAATFTTQAVEPRRHLALGTK